MKLTPSTISLVVGLAIPVIMILFIAGAVLLPGRNLTPEYDFVYVIGQYPVYTTRVDSTVIQHELTIQNGTLTETTQKYDSTPNYVPYPYEKDSIPRFYLHNTKEDTNKEISLEEAKQLKLSSETKSPDGFKVSFGNRSYGVFPFFFNDNADIDYAYLSTDTASKEISLETGNARDVYSFQLVGWVIK